MQNKNTVFLLIGVTLIILTALIMLYGTEIGSQLRARVTGFAPLSTTSVEKEFSWTPPGDTEPGERTLTLEATDSEGNTTTKDIIINVLGDGPLQGDLNEDGVVNVQDLMIVTSNFGQSAGEGGIDDPRADANGDGVVNMEDLGIVISNFGASLND